MAIRSPTKPDKAHLEPVAPPSNSHPVPNLKHLQPKGCLLPQFLISIETCHFSHAFFWFPLPLFFSPIPPPSLCSSWLTLGFSSSLVLCLLLASHDPFQSGPFQKTLSAFSLISTINLLVNHTLQQSCLCFYSVFMQLCKIHAAMTKCNIRLHESDLFI